MYEIYNLATGVRICGDYLSRCSALLVILRMRRHREWGVRRVA